MTQAKYCRIRIKYNVYPQQQRQDTSYRGSQQFNSKFANVSINFLNSWKKGWLIQCMIQCSYYSFLPELMWICLLEFVLLIHYHECMDFYSNSLYFSKKWYIYQIIGVSLFNDWTFISDIILHLSCFWFSGISALNEQYKTAKIKCKPLLSLLHIILNWFLSET
ncbi:hypothetical protein BDA99DRAFT_540482 [Phascolomyces articulosus]|uniref:Transmembrane protein n=1 Tax=Phascolomyces articulosus TaxID=60185 RepID=A0AAD5PCF0_9FUNG|nr:hypothetical protein BDA99DRAFT_540482 [Phascolomyces articulosus]